MKISEVLKEENGKFSSTRLAFLLWTVGTLLVWIFNSIASGTLQPVPQSVIVVLGILMTGKVTQKFGEKRRGHLHTEVTAMGEKSEERGD